MENLIHGNVFYEFAAILAMAAAVGALGFKLRQPLIVSFLVAGVLAGPSGFGLIESHDKIELLAKIGISLLLFVVGLRLDLHMIRTVGPVALATGLGQVIITSILGLGIALALGMAMIPAAYVAVALTFSSTIIVVKLLSDKREIDSLHGRIAVGLLLVQDIVVILAMIGLTALGGGLTEVESPAGAVALILGKGAAFLGLIAALMYYLLPYLLPRLARSQELLALFAIAWAVLLGALGDFLGFGKEVGAFLGGVSLASTDYREAIGARLVALRDFLLLFFFLDLGARLEIGVVSAQMADAAIFSLFVLVGHPLIVMAIMGYMGYRRRTGFLTGLAVAQISEFSLILGALGVSLGHIDANAMGLITLVGVATICASTYLILYSGQWYERLSSLLAPLERKHAYRETAGAAAAPGAIDIILLGLGAYGGEIAKNLMERNKRVIGVDFDPRALELWRGRGLPVVYGDGADPEMLDLLPIAQSRWIVCTVRDRDVSLALVKILKGRPFTGKVALSARSLAEAEELAAAGAAVVFRPYRDAAEYAADALTEPARLLHGGVDWPITLKEVRLRPGSVFSGRTIAEIALPAETGVTILALSRAGKAHFDMGPSFRVYPGDHLILMGAPARIKDAEEFLGQRIPIEGDQEPETFALGQVAIPPGSAGAGRTIADLRIRKIHEVTVIGIQRGEERISSPSAADVIKDGDTLIVVGSKAAIERFQERPFQP